MSNMTKLSRSIAIALLSTVAAYSYAADTNIDEKLKNAQPSETPMHVLEETAPPLLMLGMSREHTMFQEAYNDYTDIDGDGKLDIMFDPSIEYEGIYDFHLCYKYSTDTSKLSNISNNHSSDHYYLPEDARGYWYPTSKTTTKSVSKDAFPENWTEDKTVNVCDGSSWSGNFLNYLTSSKVDVLRRVLYGGSRFFNDVAPTKTSKQVRFAKDGDSSVALLKHSHTVRDAHSWGKVLSGRQYNYHLNAKDFTDLSDTKEKQAYFFVISSKDSSDTNITHSSSYIRYALAQKAGVPGYYGKEDTANDTDKNSPYAYIWDWASRQSYSENNAEALASLYVGFPSKTNKCLFDVSTNNGSCNQKITTRSAIVATCTQKFHEYGCRKYGNYWQPAGVLQEYGESENPRINFGLITGSYTKRSVGAELRSEIDKFSEEITLANQETNLANKVGGDINIKEENGGVIGIIGTLDRLGIYTKFAGEGYNNGGGVYNDCDRTTVYKNYTFKSSTFGQTIPDNKCKDWGNPVSKLMLAAAQYFEGSATFAKSKDSVLGLGYANANNGGPYKNQNTKVDYCSKPATLIIADEDISFDNNDYNGAIYSAYKNELDSIPFKSGKYFVGNSASDDSGYNNIPSAKQVNKLSDISGIAPSAPYSYGSYLTAGITKSFASRKYINAVSYADSTKSQQHSLNTYVVAMKPAMPEIKIDVGNGSYVTILPFGKTVADFSRDWNNKTDNVSKLATNTVADFYSQYISDTEGIFRINYEDMQYGSDYDMDWVVEYHYKLINGSDGSKYVQILLSNIDGDPYAPQHAGYVITGTENDGVYVDLGKFTAKNTEESENNLYDYDTLFSDAYSDALNNSAPIENYFINQPPTNITKGKTKNDFNYNSNSIVNHYNKIIQNKGNNDKPYYYMNRTEMYYNTNHNDKWKLVGSTNTWWTRVIGDFCRSKNSNNGECFNVKHNDNLIVSSRIFKVKEGATEPWVKSPLWYAAKYGIAPPEGQDWPDANDTKDPDNYFLVTNPSKLRVGIEKMIDLIDTSLHTPSAMSTENGPSISSGSNAYVALYDPSVWYGDIKQYKVGSQGNYDSEANTWSAFETFNGTDVDDRLIVTYDHTTNEYVRFHSNGYDDASHVQDMPINIINQVLNTSFADKSEFAADSESVKFMTRFARWMAGDHDKEGNENSEDPELLLVKNDNKPLRTRESSKGKFILGDIINSTPTVFKDNTVDGKSVIVVGSNDGMLHFINATNGKPIVSYLPTQALSKIKVLASQSYVTNHQSFVDSTPSIFKDVKNGKVVLFGTFGLGLEGAYALDVTNISALSNYTGDDAFNEFKDDNRLIWELLPQTTINGETIGSKFAGRVKDAPTALKVTEENGVVKYYLLLNSGYNSQDSGLIIVDLLESEEDTKLAKVVNEITAPNMKPSADPRGLNRADIIAKPVITDLTGTDNYEAIYFGDSFGQIWKIDLSRDAIRKRIACWGQTTCGSVDNSEFNPQPRVIFKAVDSNGVAQPITTELSIGFHLSGIGIIFGTGSYDLDVDGTVASLAYNSAQSVYMIRDMADDNSVNSSMRTIERCSTASSTAPSCILQLKYGTNNKGEYVYTVPNDSVSDNINRGWVLDLDLGTGERVTISPLVVHQYLHISATTPDVTGTCTGGGTSRMITFNNWRGQEIVSEEERTPWLATGLSFITIDGVQYAVMTGDAGSSPTQKYVTPPVLPKPMKNPLIINTSWLKLH